jgi:protein TorT
MRLVRAIATPSASGPDYFLGNAVAIEAAANFKRYNPIISGQPIAFYASEPVVELIKQGRVLAAASDAPVLQARIAIDLALRALEKQPHARRVGPEIDMIDATSVLKYDYRRIFAPSNQRITQQALPD